VFSFSPSVAFPGEPFSLTVQGVGFPYSTDKSTNLGPRQRLKLVPAGKSCEVKVPSEVKGIGCTKTMERVSTGDGMRERVVYVVCNPRPASSTAEMAEFGPITVAATAFGDSVYDVCYCATACHDRMSWEKVAGSLTVAKAEYAWTVTPSPVPRKLAGPVVLSVTRPPFGTFTNAAEWRVKIVRDHFGCGVCGDPSKFAFASLPAPVATNGTVSQSIDCGQPGDYIAGPDTVTWTYTVTADMDDVGTYLVCFAETAEGPFKPILGMEKEPGVEVSARSGPRASARHLPQPRFLAARRQLVLPGIRSRRYGAAVPVGLAITAEQESDVWRCRDVHGRPSDDVGCRHGRAICNVRQRLPAAVNDASGEHDAADPPQLQRSGDKRQLLW
jgi:hypothetical protein